MKTEAIATSGPNSNDGGYPATQFSSYISAAVKMYQAKGGNVILASMVPHNPFMGAMSPPPHVDAMKSTASSTSSKFIDMYSLVLAAMKGVDANTGRSYYTDSLHTNAAGATKIASVGAKAIAPLLSGGGGGGGGGGVNTTQNPNSASGGTQDTSTSSVPPNTVTNMLGNSTTNPPVRNTGPPSKTTPWKGPQKPAKNPPPSSSKWKPTWPHRK